MGRLAHDRHTGRKGHTKVMTQRMKKKSTIKRLKGRILVVDDEPEMVAVLRDLLRVAGFSVETAKNGKQAIDLLATSRHFDLMITDMKMPGMDGLELMKTAQELKKTLPVVILTGHATVDNGIHSLEEGACEYLLKPFNTETLMLAVKGALNNRSGDA
jgi:DNA-binding NtrC family response regulator